MEITMTEVKYIRQTYKACPSQWEGELENGRDFNVRYRWGWLTLYIPFGTTVFSKQLGDDLSGFLSVSNMIAELSQHLDFSHVDWTKDD